jgi:hypothetical protein
MVVWAGNEMAGALAPAIIISFRKAGSYGLVN